VSKSIAYSITDVSTEIDVFQFSAKSLYASDPKDSYGTRTAFPVTLKALLVYHQSVDRKMYRPTTGVKMRRNAPFGVLHTILPGPDLYRILR